MRNQSSNNNDKNKILIDEPITEPEQDKLHRKEFAKHFAEMLLGHTDPSCLIAALYGHWGSGKSSLLNLIENHLRANPASKENFIVIMTCPHKGYHSLS